MLAGWHVRVQGLLSQGAGTVSMWSSPLKAVAVSLGEKITPSAAASFFLGAFISLGDP